MGKILGYDVRHLPCRHERFIEAASVELALLLGGSLICLECNEIDGLSAINFEVLGPKHLRLRSFDKDD